MLRTAAPCASPRSPCSSSPPVSPPAEAQPPPRAPPPPLRPRRPWPAVAAMSALTDPNPHELGELVTTGPPVWPPRRPQSTRAPPIAAESAPTDLNRLPLGG